MAYAPERGDVVWMDFDPQAGHEQGGRRPALILSPSSYNGRTGLAILCPITVKVEAKFRSRRYEIELDDDVIKALKAKAKRKRTSLSRLASELLRQQLSSAK